MVDMLLLVFPAFPNYRSIGWKEFPSEEFLFLIAGSLPPCRSSIAESSCGLLFRELRALKCTTASSCNNR